MTADRSTCARRACGAAPLVATGAALASLPDLDGDGLPDLIIGAPGDGSQPATTVRVVGGAAGGAARVYAGNLVGAILPCGISCPGSFLITPRIDLLGDPLPAGEVTLSITKGLGGSFALLFLGGGQGKLSLAGPAPGTGTAVVTGRIPVSVPAGSVITMQALVSDAGADGLIAATSAIQLTVQ